MTSFPANINPQPPGADTDSGSGGIFFCGKRIARVFPRRTSMSPNDNLSFFGPPGLFPPDVDEVHISVTWDDDMRKAEWLFRSWRHVAPVKLDGPVISPGGEFTPGMYLRPGMIITSRGCPNNCWFCRVPRIEGRIKELEIKNGFNVLDDNLLACSQGHIDAVFEMLSRQKQRAIFSGGLDPKLMTSKIAHQLKKISPSQIYLAYDTDDDFEAIRSAAIRLTDEGFERHSLYCYVLIGYAGDSFEAAKGRLDFIASCQIAPKAMLWHQNHDKKWKRFQRRYFRDALLYAEYKNIWRLSKNDRNNLPLLPQ